MTPVFGFAGRGRRAPPSAAARRHQSGSDLDCVHIQAVEVAVLREDGDTVRASGRADPRVLDLRASACPSRDRDEFGECRRNRLVDGQRRICRLRGLERAQAAARTSSDSAKWTAIACSAMVTTEIAASSGSRSVASMRPCSSAMNTDVSRSPLTSPRRCPAGLEPARRSVPRQLGRAHAPRDHGAPTCCGRGAEPVRQQADGRP